MPPQYYANWERVRSKVVDKWYEAVDDIPLTAEQLNAAIRELSKEERVPKHRYPIILASLKEQIYKCLKRWYPRLIDPDRPNFDTIRAVIPTEAAYPDVAERLFAHVEQWERDVADPARAAHPLPQQTLAAFVRDKQNVHTTFVNKQTNDNAELLRKVPVPRGQQTLDEILTEWLGFRPYDGQLESVLADMRAWGTKSHIIEEGDYAYRVLLRTLWAKIKSFEGETRAELVKRLWEECSESVGMCAQGHLSRLSNVLVGFIDGYKPPMNSMETFQDKMAELGRSEEPLEAKVAAAGRLMDELEMPLEDRAAWLEAL